MISYRHQLIKDSKLVTLFSDRNKEIAVGCSLPLRVLFFFSLLDLWRQYEDVLAQSQSQPTREQIKPTTSFQETTV